MLVHRPDHSVRRIPQLHRSVHTPRDHAPVRQDRYSGDNGKKDKDNTDAVVGGLLLGGLLLGALAAGSKDNNSGGSPSDSRQAIDSCSNEAMNQASRYGSRVRIDRITYARPQGRGYSVQGYVAADVGPRTVTYSFNCDYDGRYARVELN